MTAQPLIFWGTADTRPAVRCRTRRAMVCRPLGCPPRHVDVGEEIVLSAAVLDQLDPADIDILGDAPPELDFSI